MNKRALLVVWLCMAALTVAPATRPIVLLVDVSATDASALALQGAVSRIVSRGARGAQVYAFSSETRAVSNQSLAALPFARTFPNFYSNWEQALERVLRDRSRSEPAIVYFITASLPTTRSTGCPPGRQPCDAELRLNLDAAAHVARRMHRAGLTVVPVSVSSRVTEQALLAVAGPCNAGKCADGYSHFRLGSPSKLETVVRTSLQSRAALAVSPSTTTTSPETTTTTTIAKSSTTTTAAVTTVPETTVASEQASTEIPVDGRPFKAPERRRQHVLPVDHSRTAPASSGPNVFIIVAGTVAGLSVLVALVIGCFCFRRRRASMPRYPDDDPLEARVSTLPSQRIATASNLHSGRRNLFSASAFK